MAVNQQLFLKMSKIKDRLYQPNGFYYFERIFIQFNHNSQTQPNFGC
jgi:hypothetical protein